MTDPGLRQNTRDAGIDALRVFLTVLVIFHHAAITYGALGGWYYHEIRPGPTISSLLLILFTAVNQAFFMGLFFLLAGYFTPGAIARHGRGPYLMDRLCRLGIPLLVYGVVIGPATIALAATARGQAFWPNLVTLWSSFRFDVGPLWFVQALLIFGTVALLWTSWAGGTSATKPRPFPGNERLASAVLAVAAGAFMLRLGWPVGTEIAGMQIGYFASYLLLFTAGMAGARDRWWTAVPPRQAALWLVVTVFALPVLPAVAIAARRTGWPAGTTDGGWSLPAFTYALWEPLVACGLILGLLRVAVRLGPHLGTAWSVLGRASYGAYLVHPPILVAITLAGRGISAPPLAKFVVAGAVASILSFAGASLLVRLPLARRIV